MKRLGAHEAKMHLSRLLKAIDGLRNFRKGRRLGPSTIRELVDEGRRR